MNLTDLQKELRSMEEHISELQKAIEEMKPKTKEEAKKDFATITRLALKYPIKDTGVSKVTSVLQKEYMQALSWLLMSSEGKIKDRLLYLCRIASGCGMELHAEELYQAGLEFQPEDMEKICMDLQKLRYAFLADALVIANISGEASGKEILLIADIARVFGCEKEEIEITGLVAKGILTEDWDVLEKAPAPKKDRWTIKENFKGLIPEEWIISHRRECGRLCVKKYEKSREDKIAAFAANMLVASGFEAMNGIRAQADRSEPLCFIKSRLQAGELVKSGDVLVTYEKEMSEKEMLIEKGFFRLLNESQEKLAKQEENIYAPCDGMVFFLEDSEKDAETNNEMKYITVYVVSYFDDYQKLSRWYRKNRMRKEKQ